MASGCLERSSQLRCLDPAASCPWGGPFVVTETHCDSIKAPGARLMSSVLGCALAGCQLKPPGCCLISFCAVDHLFCHWFSFLCFLDPYLVALALALAVIFLLSFFYFPYFSLFSLPVLSTVFFNSVGFFFVACFMPLCFFFP